MNQGWKARGAAAVLLGLVVAGAACGGGGGVPDVAADVFGQKIPGAETEELLEVFLNTENGKKVAADPEFDKEDLTQTVLTFQIKNAIIDHIAEQEGIPTEDQEADKNVENVVSGVSEEALQNEGLRGIDVVRAHKSARLAKAIALKRFKDAPVSDEAVVAEYELRKSKKLFDTSWKMAVNTAIMRSQEHGEQLRSRVQAGEKFNDVATELGGVVGPDEVTPLSPYDKKVIDALAPLQVGQMTEVIKIALDGFYVGQVEERQDTPALSFDDVKDTLRAILEDAKRQELFEDWLFTRIQKAQVKVDGHYGKWDPKTGNVV